MSDIKKKLDELFDESKQDIADFEEILSDTGSRFSMEDFTPEERKEVEQAVAEMQARRPKQPKPFFKWTFTGRLLMKILLYVVEAIILFIGFWFVLPFAINTSVTFLQAGAITALLLYIKFWWK
jgi:ABC-type multidrug transport system fused ATPase/permease subunit